VTPCCSITDVATPTRQKNTLSAAGLEHAKAHDSEAVTVMSARQCPAFRRGLAKCLEKINAALVDVRVQVRRFQVCCILPSFNARALNRKSFFDSNASFAMMT
jgi:hypothetical protein